jgi:beta-galactosidase
MKTSMLKVAISLALAASAGLVSRADPAETGLRDRIHFNNGWRFIQGDPADASGKLGYAQIKAWVEATGREFTTNAALAALATPDGPPGGVDPSYAQPGFDDHSWRLLNLPHDWGIEGPFKQEYPGETGKLPWWGVGWYRKHFTVPATDRSRRLYLDVDGAMAYATVWMNGRFVGGWPYGYASWRVDLTPFIRFGADNLVAIRLDNPPDSSRWYPGGGIYRNVWLVKTAPVHVDQWGTYVTTPEVSKACATVSLRVNVRNDSPASRNVYVQTRVCELNRDGRKGPPVETTPPTLLMENLPPGTSQPIAVPFKLASPRLWSTSTPNLYLAETRLGLRPGGPDSPLTFCDEYETVFGVRTIRFDPDHGFLLNGRRVPLQGVCDHHDLGALGAAINRRALQRQITILRQMGCNAIRTSHNPPAPELLCGRWSAATATIPASSSGASATKSPNRGHPPATVSPPN